jgi:hypothetical protein
MELIRIEAAWRHFERRILECRECGQSESYTVSTRARDGAEVGGSPRHQQGEGTRVRVAQGDDRRRGDRQRVTELRPPIRSA